MLLESPSVKYAVSLQRRLEFQYPLPRCVELYTGMVLVENESILQRSLEPSLSQKYNFWMLSNWFGWMKQVVTDVTTEDDMGVQGQFVIACYTVDKEYQQLLLLHQMDYLHWKLYVEQ